MQRLVMVPFLLVIPGIACVSVAWDKSERSARAGLESKEPRASSTDDKPAGDDDKVRKTPAEWRKILTPYQYNITRLRGTEKAYTGPYWNHHEAGTYRCLCCGADLFSSDHKFDSRTGWPSFFQSANDKALQAAPDRRHGTFRVEVKCRRCDAHLGHVFNDGPPPTGMRFCINSVSLKFAGKDEPADPATKDAATKSSEAKPSKPRK